MSLGQGIENVFHASSLWLAARSGQQVHSEPVFYDVLGKAGEYRLLKSRSFAVKNLMIWAVGNEPPSFVYANSIVQFFNAKL
jgi:hypothetical protein